MGWLKYLTDTSFVLRALEEGDGAKLRRLTAGDSALKSLCSPLRLRRTCGSSSKKLFSDPGEVMWPLPGIPLTIEESENTDGASSSSSFTWSFWSSWFIFWRSATADVGLVAGPPPSLSARPSSEQRDRMVSRRCRSWNDHTNTYTSQMRINEIIKNHFCLSLRIFQAVSKITSFKRCITYKKLVYITSE